MTMTLTEHVLELQRQLGACLRGLPADLPEFARSLYHSSEQEGLRQQTAAAIWQDIAEAHELLKSIVDNRF